MPKRRKPKLQQREHPSFKAIQEWSRVLATQVGAALRWDRDELGGIKQLERAIANVSGGFPILERRKLNALIAAKTPEHLALSFGEMAVLDVFWSKRGGFVDKLRARTLAVVASTMEVAAIFVPSLASPDDPEGPGTVPFDDVRAENTLREILRGQNPYIRFERYEVPREPARLDKLVLDRTGATARDLLDFILTKLDTKVAVFSIGSGRTNVLSRCLLEDLGVPNDAFQADGKDRFLLTGRGQRLRDRGLIVHRRISPQRIDVVIAGDSSLSTVAAAREVSHCRGESPADAGNSPRATSAVVSATLDESRRELLSSRIEYYGFS